MSREGNVITRFIKRVFRFTLFVVILGLVIGYFAGYGFSDYYKWYKEIKGDEIANKNNLNSSDEFSDDPNDNINYSDSYDDINDENEYSSSQKKFRGYEEADIDDFKSVPGNKFRKIDKYADACPESSAGSVKELADYLEAGCNSEIEKVRAIYRWLCMNIAYDDERYNGELNGNYSAEEALSKRKAVCGGVANLFYALGNEMDLEVEKVSGYAKGYSFSNGKKDFNSGTNHAWNLVKINGAWKIFDATWGAGSGTNVGGKLLSQKEFTDYWFDVDPYESIFTHLPEKSSLALVSPSPSLSDYINLPYISASLFSNKIDAEEIYAKAMSGAKLDFPTTYSNETYVEFKKVPLERVLNRKEAYQFEIYVPQGVNVALVDEDHDFHYFKRNKGVFSLTYAPNIAGELGLFTQAKGQDNFSGVLTYEIK